MEAPHIDDIIRNCIDYIFEHYDDDGSGCLDKEECFNFFMNQVKDFTQDIQETQSEDEEEDLAKKMEQFDQLYLKVDREGDGTIDKDEMFYFIKELLEL